MVSAQLPSNKTKSRPLTVVHSHVSSACFFISCLLRCVYLGADMFIHRLWTSKQRLIKQVAENPFRGRFTTETQRERRLEIQREQRR